MRAQILKTYGGPENFALTDIPKPAIEPGKVLVRLAATSVNQVDIKIRGGLPIGPARPAVLGADVAGIVEEIGAGVIGFAAGDEVYGCAGGVKGQGGTLAEYILADARLIAPKPRSLSMREAAALPLVAITTRDALERCLVRSGEHVLGRDRHGRILRSLADMVDAGKLMPLLDDSHYTLETAPDAHRRLESGKTHGKVVIDITTDLDSTS